MGDVGQRGCYFFLWIEYQYFLVRTFRGELGTDDSSEESAVELLSTLHLAGLVSKGNLTKEISPSRRSKDKETKQSGQSFKPIALVFCRWLLFASRFIDWFSECYLAGGLGELVFGIADSVSSLEAPVSSAAVEDSPLICSPR